jgi:hypothetical protein
MRSVPSRLVLPSLAVLLTACAGGEASEPAELVLRGGTILTVDSTGPRAEALAVRDGRIVAVGTEAEVEAFIGEGTEVLELDGATAIPGFVESHAHYMGLGRSTLQLDLTTATTWDEIVEIVAAAVAEAEPGELIEGRGWHQEKWVRTPEPHVDGLPHHDRLSAVSPENPVLLTHASGHATFANARAMELSGIIAETTDPAGGEIVRDAAGAPIGAFRETASGLLAPARAEADPPDPARVALLAQEEAFANGITSFHDAGTSFGTVDLYRDLVDAGDLKIRLYVMIRADNAELAEKMEDYTLVGYGDHRLTVRAIKKSIDGALGSHGAWLLEPYADLPSSTGLNTVPPAAVREAAELALRHGWQLAVHAIGDRANRETLDIFEAAYHSADAEDLRWRVEHAQHLHPDDVARFGELGVVAAVQAVHATSDGPWVEAKLGPERTAGGAYVWQDLLRTGAVVSNGTDAPVEDVSPIASYHSSVTRVMGNGERFYPEQSMSRMEALRSYTLAGAYAAFQEELIGSLVPGKLADITVLDTDLLEASAEEVARARVLTTIVGGDVVYRSGS